MYLSLSGCVLHEVAHGALMPVHNSRLMSQMANALYVICDGCLKLYTLDAIFIGNINHCERLQMGKINEQRNNSSGGKHCTNQEINLW